MNAPGFPSSDSPRVAICLLTGGTRGAVATVALEGVQAGELLTQCFQPAAGGQVLAGQVRYGLWQRRAATRDDDHDASDHGSPLTAESVVVTRSPDRPAAVADAAVTATEAPCESWEVHCHGGVAAAGRIIDDLRCLGAAVLDAGAWLQWRDQPLLVREACEVLRHATSVRTAAVALDQVRGAMRDFAERALHHQGGDAQSWREVCSAAAEYLRYAAAGLHIVEPWRVVLAGPPNVGKSSLINALLGYRRSITLDQPGTTRDVVEAQTVIDGWPIRLSDTAGIHDQPQCEIEHAGIRLARGELQQADLVLWVRDATTDQAPGIPTDVGQRGSTAVLHVINKVDLAGESAAAPSEAIATSAVTGEGLDALRQRIAQLLAPSVPPPGAPVPVTRRQVDCLRRLASATSEAAAVAAIQSLRGG